LSPAQPDTLAAAKRALPAGAIVLKSDSGSLSAAQSLGKKFKSMPAVLTAPFLNAGVAQFGPLERR